MSGYQRKFPFVFYGRSVQFDWASVEHLLGKVPDPEIAEMLGCHRNSVMYTRQLAGIPNYSIRDIVRPMLGQYPDQMVADEHGLARSTVGRFRREEGIAPCSRARLMKLRRARREAEQEEAP